MVTPIMDNLELERLMEKEFTLGTMEKYMMENGIMALNTVMGYGKAF